MAVEVLEIDVQVNSADAIKALDSVAESIKKLSAKTTDKTIGKLSSSIEAINKALSGISTSSIEKVERLASALSVLSAMGTIPKIEISDRSVARAEKAASQAKSKTTASNSALNEKRADDYIRNASSADLLNMKYETAREKLIDMIDKKADYGQLASQIEKVQKYHKALQETSKSTSETEGKTSKLNSALETASSVVGGLKGKLVSLGLKAIGKVTDEIKSSVNTVKNTLKDISSNAISGIINATPVAKVANALGNVSKSLKGVFKSLLRIATYRLFRTLIKNVTTALNNGIAAIYQYESALGHAFGSNMDSFTSGLQDLTGNLGAMAANIINLLAPAINGLISLVNSLVSALSALFAMLGGGIFVKASGNVSKYGDSLSSAGGSASEFKNQLMSFDEINKLEDQSSGGGGGSSGISYVEAELTDWMERVKELVESGYWEEAGVYLARELNDIIEGIDTIAWGRKLGEKINNGIKFAMGFFANFDFEQVGRKFAQAIRGIFERVSAENLGNLMANILNAPYRALLGFANSVQSLNIGKWLGDLMNSWVRSIDYNAISSSLVSIIGWILQQASDFISTFDWSTAINNVSVMISDLLKGLAEKIVEADIIGNLTEKIKEVDWYAVGENFGSGIADLTDALSDQLSKIDFGEIFEALESLARGALSQIDFSKLGEVFWDLVTLAIKAKLAFKGGIIAGIFEGLILKIGGTADTETEEIGNTASDNITTPVNDAVNTATKKASEGATEIETEITTAVDNALAKSTELEEISTASAEEIVSAFNDGMDEVITQYNQDVKKIESSMTAMASKVSNSVRTAFNNMKTSSINAINQINAMLNTLNRTVTTSHVISTSYRTSYSNSSLGSTDKYASGGTPSTGSLFIAGESGAELVSSVSGRTTVSNKDQIANSVSIGNEGVVSAVYAMANAIVSSINSKDMDVSLDGMSLARKMYKYNNTVANEHGSSLIKA